MSSVPEVHQPAQSEERKHKIRKATDPISETLAIRPLAHDAKYDRTKKGEQETELEVGSCNSGIRMSFLIFSAT